MIYRAEVTFLLLNFFNDMPASSGYKFAFDQFPGRYSDKDIEDNLMYCHSKGLIALSMTPHIRQGFAKLTSKGAVHLASLQGSP